MYNPNVSNDLQVCYRVLELEPGVTLDEVKRSYRELVKVWHPDRFTGDAKLHQKAEEKLKQINRAYEVLEEVFLNGGKAEQKAAPPRPPQGKNPHAERDEFFQRGNNFYFGNNVSKNLPEAARWLKKSAELGLDKAQALLGSMYYKGEGVSKDSHEAARLLKLAADQKNPIACFWLGRMHEKGFGTNFLHKVVKAGVDWQLGDSKIEAYKWFNLAVTHGCMEGLEGMSRIDIYLTQGQINEARTRAAKFYPPYPDRSARQTIAEWFKAYIQELSKNPKSVAWRAEVMSALEHFKGLEMDITETAFKNLQDKFFANRTAKTSNFFKTVGAVWKGKLGMTASRDENARQLAYRFVEDAYGLSPRYVCIRENFMNHLWLNIYAGS